MLIVRDQVALSAARLSCLPPEVRPVRLGQRQAQAYLPPQDGTTAGWREHMMGFEGLYGRSGTPELLAAGQRSDRGDETPSTRNLCTEKTQ